MNGRTLNRTIAKNVKFVHTNCANRKHDNLCWKVNKSNNFLVQKMYNCEYAGVVQFTWAGTEEA